MKSRDDLIEEMAKFEEQIEMVQLLAEHLDFSEDKSRPSFSIHTQGDLMVASFRFIAPPKKSQAAENLLKSMSDLIQGQEDERIWAQMDEDEDRRSKLEDRELTQMTYEDVVGETPDDEVLDTNWHRIDD